MKNGLTKAGVLIMTLIIATGCATSTPSVQQGPSAEVTFDGLHRVNNTVSDRVYIKPDIDLSQYDELLLVGGGIQYRDAEPYRRNDSSQTEFALTDVQKQRLREAVGEVLFDEIKQTEHFTITDKAGKGVLQVKIGLIDVVSRVPPEQEIGRHEYFLSDLGQATLIMELSDSRTGEVLARIADARRVEPNTLHNSNPVTNIFEVKRSARVWGVRIANGLDELHQLGCYVCNIPGEVN